MEYKRITDINGLMHLWKVDNLYLAGQPSIESFEKIKELGVTKIINLRSAGEMDFSAEIEKVNSLGLEYVQFPIVENGELNAENCERLSKMIDKENPHFIHCGSANRVAGWLITYLTDYRGMSFDDAVEIAEQNGLSNPGFIDQAEMIVKK